MPLAIPVRESRDRWPVVNADGEVIHWADFNEAHEWLKNGEVKAIRSKGGKGRIKCLALVEHHATTVQKPTSIRQHGSMGDSHTNIRECGCHECRDNGSPIPRHLQRSTNPPGVWTIDALPHWGKGDWKTRAIFRRPLLEAIYGKEHVERCLNPPPASQSQMPLSKAA